MDSQYTKISSLGEGNFGLALLCQRTDGIQIVLKKIVHRSDAKVKENAENEAKILSKLNHPYIVRAYQTFRSLNSTYIEMEYMEGGTLANCIAVRGYAPFPNVQIYAYLQQIASALDYIHNVHSIVHRDVKPDNIFLDASTTTLKLADFGIATIVPQGKMLSGKIGTSCYMAPEILNAHDYSFGVDVWSFGCVAFELVERRRCFEGSNEFAVQFKIISGTVPASESIFGDLIKKMMTMYPAERPTSAEVILMLNKLSCGDESSLSSEFKFDELDCCYRG